VLIQIVEANGTLQPTHDSRKFDGLMGPSWSPLPDGKACLVLELFNPHF
jgi:hypothetical protein